MPLSAAISIPLGAVAVVALLLALAHCQRKRTERCLFRLLLHVQAHFALESCYALSIMHARRPLCCCAQADRPVLQAGHPGRRCATQPLRGEQHLAISPMCMRYAVWNE
jgi:hypothetical protein